MYDKSNFYYMIVNDKWHIYFNDFAESIVYKRKALILLSDNIR